MRGHSGTTGCRGLNRGKSETTGCRGLSSGQSETTGCHGLRETSQPAGCRRAMHGGVRARALAAGFTQQSAGKPAPLHVQFVDPRRNPIRFDPCPGNSALIRLNLYRKGYSLFRFLSRQLRSSGVTGPIVVEGNEATLTFCCGVCGVFRSSSKYAGTPLVHVALTFGRRAPRQSSQGSGCTLSGPYRKQLLYVSADESTRIFGKTTLKPPARAVVVRGGRHGHLPW